MLGLLDEKAHMDALDRDILIALQREGRQSNLALARALGMSPSAMLGRVRRLERSGAIRGYRAIIDPAALGIGLHALVIAQLREHSQSAIAAFEAGVKELSGVRACYHVTGEFDMIVMLALRDLEHLAQLIRVDLALIPGVTKLETMLILAEPVVDQGWPILPVSGEQTVTTSTSPTSPATAATSTSTAAPAAKSPATATSSTSV
jgi:Lrp/AsnC family leucine-responsive transcriptional regulator